MRTNKIFNVQVAQYAWMAVEADSPQEAMELAKRFTDEITERDFKDSEVSVCACEKYASDIDDYYEDNEPIYTKDGIIKRIEYHKQLKSK